jgi:ParB-like chromosome segregation protein Spo0J
VRLVEHRVLVAADLLTPKGWRELLNADNLEGLRLELRAGRKLPPIQVVEAGAGRHEVVKGFHRLAAHLDEGLDEIRADVVEYDSEDEREVDVLAENLRRRQLPIDEYRAGLRRLVALYEVSPEDRSALEDQLDAELGGPSEDAERNSSARADQLPTAAKPGRPASTKRKAIKKAAATAGASEDTVERALKPKDDEPAAKAPPAPAVPSIRAFGLDVPAAVDAKARRVQAQVDEADKLLRALAKVVNGMEDAGVPGKFAQVAVNALKLAGDAIRGLRPSALCPWCKGFADVADCYFCSAGGYADAERMKRDIPEDLLLEGDAAMVANGTGRFRKVKADALPKAPKRGLGGRSLKVEIVDQDGAVTEAQSLDGVEMGHRDDEAF